jgi:hypothetical protein
VAVASSHVGFDSLASTEVKVKRILKWVISFNPLLPFLSVALMLALVGQNVSYEIVIP